MEQDLKDSLVAIAESGNLTRDQMLIALFEACGVRPGEIARRMGKSREAVYYLRTNDDNYRKVLQQLHAEVAKCVVDQFADAADLFNQQIGPSAQTLIEVRDDPFASESARIKASLAFLDRAPRAPKATQQTDVRQMVISFPVRTMQEMQQALMEEGSPASLQTRQILELEAVEAGFGAVSQEVSESESPPQDVVIRRLD